MYFPFSVPARQCTSMTYLHSLKSSTLRLYSALYPMPKYRALTHQRLWYVMQSQIISHVLFSTDINGNKPIAKYMTSPCGIFDVIQWFICDVTFNDFWLWRHNEIVCLQVQCQDLLQRSIITIVFFTVTEDFNSPGIALGASSFFKSICLFVSVSVKNLNLCHYSFWTIRAG